ncbi:MAG TPA: acetate--CoA ligase [bacterium]|nr:acetate--CoA ligase [bacterium]
MAEDKKSIISMSLEDRVFDPPAELVKDTYIKSMAEYEKLHKESIKNPDKFWGRVGEEFLTWDKKWDKVFNWDDKNQVKFSWYKGGKLNASVNCLDRHIKTWRKNKAAIIWEGDDPGTSRVLTYYDMYREVNKFANVLKSHGVKKGDRISIYLPMIPELPIAMLACARIGAIHNVVFGGFSADSLRDRINDSACKVLITSDASYRGSKVIPLKANADAAVKGAPSIEKVIVVNRANQQVPMEKGRDVWWHEEMKDAAIFCQPEIMDAEDPLFILYTSGSTGKPKGVLHTTAGFLAYTACSHKWVFDIKDNDTWWCTADIGWVTGHSYIVYGPLVNGATSLMFEGVPTYPDAGRFWAVCDKFGVNSFYTAPTAIRSLMREGESWVNKHDLSSLKILGSVGEPINPEAWIWYYENVGKSKRPIMDTYWQTETGGFLITPLPCMKTKPGSASKPFFGVECKVLREDGTECEKNEGGFLVMMDPWPGIMRTVYGDHQRFIDTYWIKFPGRYSTGDGARVDDDGYFWLMGRLDDVINVSGHRLGTAEVESALVAHPKVAEAAVVGMPHDVKGQGIYAFVTVKAGVEKSDALKKELVAHVRKEIGPIATPDKIQWADALPKTRSGKIMRRILKKIAAGDVKDLGDTTTLADPTVVESLVKGAV